MNADSSSPVILRHETDEDQSAFLSAFAEAFTVWPCRSDAEAIALLESAQQLPTVVFMADKPKTVLGSPLLSRASSANCFRILLCQQIALDEIVSLLEEQEIDRCYTRPWDTHLLRADLFTATMGIDPSNAPAPDTSSDEPPLVLIVDDETAATKYLSKQLLRLQNRFDVVSAANAEEALATLRAEGDRVAVMMTDQRMPGMRGLELINELRQSYPFVTRILTSAYGELDVALGAVNQGRIYRYEKKPWNASRLLPVLDDAIAQHTRLKAAAEHARLSAAQDFKASSDLRRQSLIDALTEPAAQALVSKSLMTRFLDDLETIQTQPPGRAHRRAANTEEFLPRLVNALRNELSHYLLPEQSTRLADGQPLPTAVVDALDILLDASGMERDDLEVRLSPEATNEISVPDRPLRMFSHLLSPLTGISRPLVQQQAALLALYLWSEKLGGHIQLSGGSHSFSLRLTLPALQTVAQGDSNL